MEDLFATRKEGAMVTREESADKEYFARGVVAIARSIVVDDDEVITLRIWHEEVEAK